MGREEEWVSADLTWFPPALTFLLEYSDQTIDQISSIMAWERRGQKQEWKNRTTGRGEEEHLTQTVKSKGKFAVQPTQGLIEGRKEVKMKNPRNNDQERSGMKTWNMHFGILGLATD